MVGDKCDLDENREVSYEEGKKLAEEHNFLFYEASAKNDINILNLFSDLAINLKSKPDESLIFKNWYKIKMNSSC